MERHICIHGHFYQPPRENPWLETVLTQDFAFPSGRRQASPASFFSS